MRHKKNNNIHSSDNHDAPQHERPDHMHYQYEKAIGPKKSSALSKVREGIARFKEARKEKPATKEEITQLRFNTQREVLKTQKQKAISSRPSKWGSFGGGERQPSYRRGSRYAPKEDSFLFGSSGGNSGGFLNSEDHSPSLDFITGGNSNQRGRRPNNDNGFSGKGLSDLF